MTPKRKKRLSLVALLVLGIGTAVGLALNAFKDNLLFFFSPSQVAAGEAPREHAFRLGGLVVNGSVQRQSDGLTVRFDLTDNAEVISVQYKGILPDLFREGQGIVAKGKLGADDLFVADEVLAKHDEDYMPPEVADSLKKSHAAGIAGSSMGASLQ